MKFFVISSGKGAGLVFKALSLTKFGASLASKARVLGGEIKQTVSKMPIPTNAGIKIVVDTSGNKMMFPDVELTKLENLIKPLESRASKILSGGKAINLPAWNKLTFKLESDGKTIHLINNHTVTAKATRRALKWAEKKMFFRQI